MTQQPSSDIEKAALIVELSQAGIKHTPEKIVRIAKLADGKIVFLEKGDDRRGLIVNHPNELEVVH
ncbi:MAG: hypothetical protein PUP93_16000 [Rhizonema sp. NSF051]|nr:hypothetical protein [Rhizonema sp. NSF051]